MRAMSQFDETPAAGTATRAAGPTPGPEPQPHPAHDDAARDDMAFGDSDSEGKGPAAIERLVAEVGLLRDQATIYLLARQDQFKLRVRRLVLVAGIGLLAMISLATVLVASAAMIVAGIARGLGELFGQLWLGQMVTGIGILGLCGLGIYGFVHRLIRISRSSTANRYAELYQQQLDRRRAAAAKSAADRIGK
jgi:hypothetical protein